MCLQWAYGYQEISMAGITGLRHYYDVKSISAKNVTARGN